MAQKSRQRFGNPARQAVIDAAAQAQARRVEAAAGKARKESCTGDACCG